MSGFSMTGATITHDGETWTGSVVYRPPTLRLTRDGEVVEHATVGARRNGPRRWILTLDGGALVEVERKGCGCRG